MFDDRPEYLGHRIKIQDNELSDAAGQIKDRLSFVENSLRITREGSGLTIRYSSGQVILPTGSVATIVSSILAVPNNTTSFVFVDRDGIPRVDSRLPAISVPLARVIAVNGVINTIEDYRHPNLRRVQPNTTALQTFGGQGTTDITTTNNQSMALGVYYVRDFTVPAGTICHIHNGTTIYASGRVTIAGTLNVYPNFYSHAKLTAYNLTAFGSVGGTTGTGRGSQGGTYSWASSVEGSGGSGGFIQTNSTSSWAYHGAGGLGGGGITIECAGSITINSGGVIQSAGYEGQAGGNAASGTAAAFRTNIGDIAISGSGGGSGGCILLRSLTSITAATGSVINVRGGFGAPGYAIAQNNGVRCIGLGGGAGGGGHIVLQSPNNQTTGSSINVTGGGTGAMLSVRASGIAEFITQPSTGVYRVESPTFFLGGGSGGGFAGAATQMSSSTAVENSINVHYFTAATGTPGLLTLLTLTPIG